MLRSIVTGGSVAALLAAALVSLAQAQGTGPGTGATGSMDRDHSASAPQGGKGMRHGAGQPDKGASAPAGTPKRPPKGADERASAPRMGASAPAR